MSVSHTGDKFQRRISATPVFEMRGDTENFRLMATTKPSPVEKCNRIHAQYGVKFAEMLFGPTEMSIVKRVALTKNAFSSLPIVSIQFSIIHL